MRNNECSCRGENPNCFKCFGTGLIDRVRNDVRLVLPPIRNDLMPDGNAGTTAFPKSRRKKEALNVEVIVAEIVKRLANGYTVRLKPEEVNFLKNNCSRAQLSKEAIAAARNEERSQAYSTLIDALFGRRRLPLVGKKYILKNPRNRNRRRINTAEMEAKITGVGQTKLVTGTYADERAHDATKDYFRIRDVAHGQFGSHPSHDDYD